MNNSRLNFISLLIISIMFSACASMNKTQKGAVVDTASGGVMGAIIGAAVGGTTGAIIGNNMDKQAQEIQKKVPDANVQRVREGIVVEFSSNVLFGFDESELTSSSKSSLNKLVTVLNEYSDTDIEVQGYTDSRGSSEYNQNLSIERASSVANYLRSNRILSSRINLVGYGESAPKYDNKSKSGRDQNRRVEFLITANEKMKAEAEKQSGK